VLAGPGGASGGQRLTAAARAMLPQHLATGRAFEFCVSNCALKRTKGILSRCES
jgi:Mg/Co/Ni transporter MgtE